LLCADNCLLFNSQIGIFYTPANEIRQMKLRENARDKIFWKVGEAVNGRLPKTDFAG
jgi:hypothetical protein